MRQPMDDLLQGEVPMFRKQGCSDWYMGFADHEDGGGPYEEQTSYTADQRREYARKAVEAEREACAKVCDTVQAKNEDKGMWMWEARDCAAAIRARGNA